MLFLFKKKSKDDEQFFAALRQMKTLKVSDGGGVSVSPHEIVNRPEFIAAREKTRKAIEK